MVNLLKFRLVVVGLTVATLFDAGGAERVFTCRNWVERDWPRTLLHDDVAATPGEFVTGRTDLIDPAGVPVEHQVEAIERHSDGSLKRGRISFHAALAKDAEWTYTLRASDKPATFPPRVTSRSHGWLRTRTLEVVSPEAGVLLPPPGEHTFRRPVAPAKVPPPILGWRLADGSWVGKTRIESDRLVTGWSQRVVADGPLYKEYEYEVRFAPGEPPRDTPGYYRDRELLMLAGSDDAIAVWINGEKRHQHEVYRALELDQERIPIRLRQGDNHLLLKIGQGTGSWGFVARLAEPRWGLPVTEGLTFGFANERTVDQ